MGSGQGFLGGPGGVVRTFTFIEGDGAVAVPVIDLGPVHHGIQDQPAERIRYSLPTYEGIVDGGMQDDLQARVVKLEIGGDLALRGGVHEDVIAGLVHRDPQVFHLLQVEIQVACDHESRNPDYLGE